MRRLLITVGSFVLGSVALYGLFSASAVRYEVWSSGALSAADLGDDLGLGILAVGVAVPASVIGGGVIAFFVWRAAR